MLGIWEFPKRHFYLFVVTAQTSLFLSYMKCLILSLNNHFLLLLMIQLHLSISPSANCKIVESTRFRVVASQCLKRVVDLVAYRFLFLLTETGLDLVPSCGKIIVPWPRWLWRLPSLIKLKIMVAATEQISRSE